MRSTICHRISALLVAALLATLGPEPTAAEHEHYIFLDLLPAEFRVDSIYDLQLLFQPYGPLEPQTIKPLTEEDYREVAEALDVEVAAIKAVVDIETGNRRQGFWKPGKALINFDLNIYSQVAPRHQVNLKEARRQAPVAFANPDIKKYGSRQAAMYARLEDAMRINEDAALESTFWGMFQIGGFNWKKCGTESVQQFVELMNRSERDQLDLFAAYCLDRDLIKHIKNKDWAAFSLRYNGPGYQKHSYDKRMADAYHRHLRKK